MAEHYPDRPHERVFKVEEYLANLRGDEKPPNYIGHGAYYTDISGRALLHNEMVACVMEGLMDPMSVVRSESDAVFTEEHGSDIARIIISRKKKVEPALMEFLSSRGWISEEEYGIYLLQHTEI